MKKVLDLETLHEDFFELWADEKEKDMKEKKKILINIKVVSATEEERIM